MQPAPWMFSDHPFGPAEGADMRSIFAYVAMAPFDVGGQSRPLLGNAQIALARMQATSRLGVEPRALRKFAALQNSLGPGKTRISTHLADPMCKEIPRHYAFTLRRVLLDQSPIADAA
jgi:hypothetical protein